jgi:iron complex outermembrane receptor protein
MNQRWCSILLLIIAMFLFPPFVMADDAGAQSQQLDASDAENNETDVKQKADETQAIKLDEVVVSATKTETALEDVPGSVSVVTSEQMEKQNVKTLDDALQYVPGVFARPKKGLMDSGPSLRIRGFGGNKYTAVLVDGMPLNDPYNGDVEFGALPVGDVERIEVIRGPASALYGGNAMAGVVNIISKTPEKLEMGLTGGIGSDDTRRYRFNIGDRFWDRLSVQFGAEDESTDGYITTPVVRSVSSGKGNVSGGSATTDRNGKDNWIVGDMGKNGAEHQSVNGKVHYDFSDTGAVNFSAFYGRHEYDYDAPHTYMGTFGDRSTYAIAQSGYRASFQPNDFISGTGIGRTEKQGYGLSANELIGPVKLNANASYQYYDDRYTLETGSGAADYDDSPGMLKITGADTWYGDLQGTLPLGDSHLLTVGGSYRYDDATTDDYNIPFYRSYDGPRDFYFTSGGKAKAWSFFAQDQWSIIEPVTLYLGFRYDNWNVFDGFSGAPNDKTRYNDTTKDSWSPRAAVVWKALSDTTLRATVGHAFRPPTLMELYRTSTSSGLTYYSNPNLKPETVWSYEAGIEQFFFDHRTKISLTGYRNDIEDLIQYRSEGNTRTRTNISESQTYGLEFEASQKITDWLNLWANYSYTDAQVKDNPTDPSSEGKQVTGIPKHMYSIGLDLNYDPVKVWLAGRYFSKSYSNSDNSDTTEGVYGGYDSAFLMDGKVTWSPLKWVDFSLAVDNILDNDYYEYYAMSGRTFMFELTLKY